MLEIYGVFALVIVLNSAVYSSLYNKSSTNWTNGVSALQCKHDVHFQTV